ncbi:MAG: undecaprenyldiphospho-muramoylpentapeptide beta-N-acetylglucosaminyltransferase [Nitrospirae bacterium]|nr:undecaprenyldiphospho-muramoylpentapeptide beta-N-acetylglucosaminyltransferase [Nitrospirota bacterium]
MKVLIAGGGTGGHLFPGLALAEEFKRRDEGTEVLFVGTEHGIEAKIIPREGYPISFLRAEGFVGLSPSRKLKAAAKVILSVMDSYKILRSVRPDIVIGVGGYASGAIVLIAGLKSIPTMVHEQNSVPGLTNKILGKFVKSVCVTYPESISSFPHGKTSLTGNPIRSKILKGDRDAACRLFSLDRDMFTVFIFGGSSGARSINRTMVDALNHLTDLKENIQFLHQTGDRDYENIREAYRKAGVKGTIAPFIYQMAEAYAAADIVISRAGATTLAEVTALGKPVILIPYPFAAGRHQEYNAMKLREMGAAQMIGDSEMRGETLAGSIRELYRNRPLREEMIRASRGLGKPDACSRIVDIALSLVKGNRNVRKV